MGLITRFKNLLTNRNKSPTEVTYQLMRILGNGTWAWNGKIYESDMIRSIIRPFASAIGKLEPKQIRTSKDDVLINPDLYVQFLLQEPNPLMTGQKFRERLAWQYMLNGNAFALIVRDVNDYAIQMYPINSCGVEAIYENGNLFLRFSLLNGKQATYSYNDIIHVPFDTGDNELFGSSNAKALLPLMTVVSASDGSIVNAIKNSGIVKWLLKYSRGMLSPELKKRAKEFSDNFLITQTGEDNIGVAAVGADADAIQIEPKDYVPNALIQDRTAKRVMEYFNTNENIVLSNYNEDQWNSYFESVIEPFSQALSEEFTKKVFSRRERSFGNRIIFDAGSLEYASMQSKLNLVQMVDRGSLTPNEWRRILNLGPIEGGDKPLRRKDTGVVGGDNDGQSTN